MIDIEGRKERREQEGEKKAKGGYLYLATLFTYRSALKVVLSGVPAGSPSRGGDVTVDV